MDKIQDILYQLLKSIVDNFTLPTDSTIFMTLKFAVGLFLLSVISSIFGIIHFISWHGALLCVLLLTAFLIKERRENDALVQAYKRAEAVAKRAANKAKATGSNVKKKIESQRSTR